MKPPKPGSPVAVKTCALASAFPRHPKQDAFLETAVTLCAADVLNHSGPHNVEAVSPGATDLDTVRAEYANALQAVVYVPTEDRFYCIWSDVANAGYLAWFVAAAWHGEPGTYGKHPPQHWVQEPSKPTFKQRKK